MYEFINIDKDSFGVAVAATPSVSNIAGDMATLFRKVRDLENERAVDNTQFDSAQSLFEERVKKIIDDHVDDEYVREVLDVPFGPDIIHEDNVGESLPDDTVDRDELNSALEDYVKADEFDAAVMRVVREHNDEDGPSRELNKAITALHAFVMATCEEVLRTQRLCGLATSQPLIDAINTAHTCVRPFYDDSYDEQAFSPESDYDERHNYVHGSSATGINEQA